MAIQVKPPATGTQSTALGCTGLAVCPPPQGPEIGALDEKAVIFSQLPGSEILCAH